MDFKPAEILAIIAALAIPILAFGLAFIPGSYAAIFNFAMAPAIRPFAFGGAATCVFAIFAYRIYRRIRPAPRRNPTDPPGFFDLWRWPGK